MSTVRQLLAAKKITDVYAVAPDAAVIEAIRLMAERGVGAVLVMQGRRLAGILSERDYARKVVLRERSSATTWVREIMTSEVVTVTPEHSADSCMRLMTDNRIRHLPVVEAGEVIGVVSIGDLVKAIIEEQQQELDHLQRYIAS